MSRHNRKRRRELKQLEVKELDTFGGPQPMKITSYNAHRIMQWVLWGKKADKEGMFDLFPLPGSSKRPHA